MKITFEKMKKLLIFILCVLLISCNTETKKVKNPYEYVREQFPNSKIYRVSNRPLEFVLVDSTGIKQVLCSSYFLGDGSIYCTLSQIRWWYV